MTLIVLHYDDIECQTFQVWTYVLCTPNGEQHNLGYEDLKLHIIGFPGDMLLQHGLLNLYAAICIMDSNAAEFTKCQVHRWIFRLFFL